MAAASPDARVNPAAGDALPSDDLTRPRLESLIRLAAPATALPLYRSTARALQSGQYLSRFKGRGMEFDETRPYVPGDDIRTLDWRVTARTGRVHTKTFREERERPVLLAVDVGSTMFFGTRGVFKHVVAARLAALIAWSAHHRGDRVGGVIFSEHGRSEFKPEHHRRTVLRLLRAMAEAVPGGSSYARPSREHSIDALTALERHAHTGSLIFLFSDFRTLDDALGERLRRLRRHGDAVLVMIHDVLERELPSTGRYRFADGQHRDVVLDLSPRAAEAHRRRFDERLRKLRGLALGSGMRLLTCATDEDPLKVLQQGVAPQRLHL
ncbi:MAG: DUF58 domain-containing protein [Methylotetracoccus sp.]